MAEGPRPIQLLPNIASNDFSIDIASLRRILNHPDVKHRRLEVLSVVGDFRSGKSFLLNFFLNYLRKNGQNNGKWLEKIPRNSGFSWRSGSKGDTTGILVWPEPFLIGDDWAVLLMDTQGTFDEKDTNKQNTLIFALNMVMSSVQIYNVQRKLQMNNMESLQLFMEYGKCGNENSNPFQKLMFLIRDWKHTNEFDFGFEGGKQMIDEQWFEAKDDNPDRKQVCDTIRGCFSDISCFLMPHPGDKVDHNVDYDGEIEDINPEFLMQLENLTCHLFSEENLTEKKFNNVTICAEDFSEFITKIATLLQRDTLPEPRSTLQNLTDATNEVAARKAISAYDTQMEDKFKNGKPVLDFILVHEAAMTAALHLFDESTKFGGPSTALPRRNIVIEGIEKRKLKYYKYNSELEKIEHNEEQLKLLPVEDQWRRLVMAQQQHLYNLLGGHNYHVIDVEDERNILENNVGFAMFGHPDLGYAIEKQKVIDKMCTKIKEQVKKWQKKTKNIEGNMYECITTETFNFAAVFLFCCDLDYNEESRSCRVIFRICNSNNDREFVFIDPSFRVYQSWDEFLQNNKFDECWYCYPKEGFYQGNENATVQVEFGQSPACSISHKALKAGDLAAKVIAIGSLGVGIASLAIPEAGPIVAASVVAAGISSTYTGGRGVNTLVDRSRRSQSINLKNKESIGAWIDIVTTPLIFASGIQAVKSLSKSRSLLSKLPTLGTLVKGASMIDMAILATDMTAKGLSVLFQIISLVLQSNGGPLSAENIANLRAQFLFYFHVFIDKMQAADIFNNLSEKLHEMLQNTCEGLSESILTTAKRSSLATKAVTALILFICKNAQELVSQMEKRGFCLGV